MKLQKRMVYSIVFAILIFFLSMFIPFVPCQTAPVVPNPTYKWTTCTLNPDSANLLGVTRKYFGYQLSLTEAYFTLITISFVLAIIVFYFVARTKKK